MLRSKRTYGPKFSAQPSKKAKTVESKVSRLQRQVALLRPEIKYHLGSVNTVNLPVATGTIFPLTTMALGANPDERVGLEVRGVYLKLINTYSRNSQSAGTHYRYFIVRDKENGGAAPAIAGAAGSVLETFNPITTFQQNTGRDRFVIIYDKLITVDAIPSIYSEKEVQQVDLKISMPIRYVGTTGTAASQGKNSLWMIILSNNGTDTADFNSYWEVAYTDV